MRDRRGESGGHAAAFEIFALIALLAVGLLAVGFVDPGEPGEARVARALDASARDALATLDALPAEDPAFSTRLEELVTRAAAGEASGLEAGIAALLPPGASFQVELDNLAGGRLHLAGEKGAWADASPGIPLAPRWSYLVLRADVEQHAGATALDSLVVRGVLVRLSYADTTTPVTLTLANGHTMSLAPGGVLRSSAASPPETPLVPGYAVSYDTSNALAWATDVADASQAESSFGAAVDPSVGVPRSIYVVHPRYTLAGEISRAMLDARAGVSFGTVGGATDYRAGDTVALEYDAGGIPGVVMVEGVVRVWDPVGRLVSTGPTTASNGRITGTYTYAIPRETLWGTHVAEIAVTMRDPLDATETYLAHRLAAFHVNPSAGFASGAAHVPPHYRVILHAWAPENA